ncbi:uncharacterized protein PV09_07765 [Verruconis gallopava]|uniref:Sugar phosphate phosphatase n=1 Tax=Verruconis gallopava TaxID=253628 RepID=A0A0D1XF01_9PEZI|nr:uncharacterized protein PV09_07765 [Verruconis gallopava]KIW00786.1 hypothetical protein PV09_07765 [Verruconis gallopava]
MEFETQTPPWSTADKNSFAYPSARDRWPVILTQAIDDVHRATAKATDPEVQAEGKQIIAQLAGLKYELQHDRRLVPLSDDGLPDVDKYNQELSQLEAKFGGELKWFNAPWLYSECYLYRRMHAIFRLSKKWQDYDVFAASKMSTFRSSRAAVLELAAQYKEIVTQLEAEHTLKHAQTEAELAAAEEAVFRDMCEICLWGNATDLSLLTNLSHDDLQKLQGSEARSASRSKVLVNDLGAAFEALYTAQKSGKKERRIDFILDNAGFELFVDLVLAGYLLTVGLATTVVLHPKTMPWFVSDVVPKDFSDLLGALADPRGFYETLSEEDTNAGKTPPPLSDKEVDELKFLFDRWANLHAEGKLVIRPNTFWTEGGSFWRLPGTAPCLHEDLKQSELCIFKGDLNYRKLTGDAMWDPTTPFSTAIGPLGPGSGLRVLALRTCKGDVVVGLPQGKDEELRALEAGPGPYERWEKGVKDSGLDARKWAWSGKWAVVQFCDGK